MISKLFQLGYIYYVTNYVTNHIIIKFHNITILFFLDTSSNKCVSISDYDLVEKKPHKPSKRLKKKLFVYIYVNW